MENTFQKLRSKPRGIKPSGGIKPTNGNNILKVVKSLLNAGFVFVERWVITNLLKNK
jgi:hypothetical protein